MASPVEKNAPVVQAALDLVAEAATAAAVLPPGLFPSDQRLAAVRTALAGRDDDDRAAALLAERPWRPPR